MATQSPPAPRLSRRVKVLLGASLALNLLFVGLIGGALWRNGGGDGPGHRDGGPSLQSYAAPYVQALPRAERRALHRSIRSAHPMAGREARRAVYAQMLEVLRAEPFDPDAAQAMLDAQRDAVMALQETAQASWLQAVGAMTPGERTAYADRLEKRIERRARRARRRED